MIKIIIGNIFDSKMDVLVNTVNCVGVMGKGIAKDFKAKYPIMFEEYKKECDLKNLSTGILYPYYEDGKVKVLNFPTKQHWRSPSKLSYIVDGLNWFVENYQGMHINSIAFPPLGCGNGGLSWDIVGPLMYQTLKELPIDIEIYAPFGVAKEKISKDFLNTEIHYQNHNFNYSKINNNWLLALQIVKILEKSQYSIKVGRIMFQKICYILTRCNVDLGLTFTKGFYGPYSKDISQMITILANNNLIYEKQLGNMILLSPTEQFKIIKENYTKREIAAANLTYSLFRDISNSAQAEVMTTILFSYDDVSKSHKNITENMLYDYIKKWKSRNKNFQDEFYIRDYIKNLTYNKMIKIDYSKDYKESPLF